MATQAHAVLIPYPAQGHVIPMFELAQHLLTHNIKVTFVNTEFNHRRVMESLSKTPSADDTAIGGQMMQMVSIPDGLGPGEDRNDLGRLSESLVKVISEGELDALIEGINAKEGQRVTCLVVDLCIGFTLEVVERLGLKRAAFWILPAASLASAFNIPKLIADGVIDQEGNLLKKEMIRLSPNVLNSTNLLWPNMGDEATQKAIFNILNKMQDWIKSTEWLICNSCLDLELEAFSQFPEILPVGPLLASNRLGRSKGHFWAENLDCLQWLDQQPPNSVIYIAFGSFTIFDQVQFKELALGLELTNQPFLWVVREDLTANFDDPYPTGFKERTQKRGMIVEWAPQQQVLSHPSVACFLTHCGWNSTIESIANGVPFLCWPYFADQFLNQTYICDEWKVGLRLNKDEKGIVRRGEIKDKVERLLEDKSYKERITSLQTKAMASVLTGSSKKNFNSFVEWIKNTK